MTDEATQPVKMASYYMPDDKYWGWLDMAPTNGPGKMLNAMPLNKDDFHPEVLGLYYTMTIARGLPKEHYEFGPKKEANCFGMIFKTKEGDSKPWLLSHRDTNNLAFRLLGYDQSKWTGQTIIIVQAQTKVHGKARNCLRVKEPK